MEDVRQLVQSTGTGTPPGWAPPAQFAVEEAGYLAVTLAWPDAAIEEDGYTLERSTDGQNWIAVAELSANTLRYVDYGLARHTRYWYRLTAHNSQGSDSPQTVQAETAAASVTIGEDWVEGEIVQTVIDYRYDALYHLTEANYSDGTFFHYTYDSNGNRVSETTEVGTVESVYDSANRLTSVGGVAYTWDANGNLLSDRVTTYTYNYANRLTGMTQGTNATGISYNGLGDRVSETVNGVTTTFTLDLNTGLTQVLADGTNTYLYGSGRICQFTGVESAYFLGDALGSVRQLADGTGVVTMASDYQPYGEKMSSIGSEETTYGYTGEWHDASTNLLYLRTRYYGSEIGRFLTRDTWEGSNYKPTSYNAWLYGNSNPILFTDPNGKCADTDGDNVCDVFPPYLNYHPRIDPLSRGASGIKPGQYQAQFINNTANQWKSKKTQNYPVSKNLCGQVSIAAILASVNSNITVFDVLDDYEEGYKNVASGSKTSDSELQGLIRRFYSDYLSTTNFPGLSNNVDRLIQNPNKDKWWSLSGRKETIETMKTFLGSVFIAGVFINGTSGTIGYQYNAPHWVVITGISDFNYKENEYWEEKVHKSSVNDYFSEDNWVRVYNPFNNQTEHLLWSFFSKSWVADGNMIFRVDRKINSPRPPHRGCEE